MTRLKRWMTGVHFFAGIGAVAGGLAAVMNPLSPMGISPEMLIKGPFSSYLIPGLFLLVILGAGNLITSLLIFINTRLSGIFSGLMGAIMVLWIIIQCYILQDVGVLHIVFFLIGSAQGIMAFAQLYQQDIFPASLVRKIIKGEARRQSP